MSCDPATLLRRTRGLLLLMIAGQLFAGMLAFAAQPQIDILQRLMGPDSLAGASWPALASWVGQMHEGIAMVSRQYSFLLYGTDWLGFAHVVIAIAFIGPIRDPVRNIWVIEFGIIACVLVIPTALISGQVRGIPVGWRLVECAFGVLGVIPLWLAHRCTRRLAKLGLPWGASL